MMASGFGQLGLLAKGLLGPGVGQWWGIQVGLQQTEANPIKQTYPGWQHPELKYRAEDILWMAADLERRLIEAGCPKERLCVDHASFDLDRRHGYLRSFATEKLCTVECEALDVKPYTSSRKAPSLKLSNLKIWTLGTNRKSIGYHAAG